MIDGLAINDMPTMDVEVGPTGYLDQTQTEDMPAVVAGGTDEHGRPFVSMLLHWKHDDGLQYQTVATFHQRYADDGSVWVLAGPCSGAIAPSSVGEEGLEKIGRLLVGEAIEIDEGTVELFGV